MLAATTVALVGLPGAAEARTARIALSTPTAVPGDCARALLGGPGVARREWTAPADGEARVRLVGRDGDWDLALFDAATGALVSASAGTGPREIATAPVRRGTTLEIQACRRTGDSAVAGLHLDLRRLDVGGRVRPGRRAALVDVPLAGGRARERLAATGAEIGRGPDERSARVVVTGSGLARLRDAGFRPRALVASPAGRAGRASARTATSSGLPTGRTTYRTLDEHQRELKEIAEAHPELARVRGLGERSIEGREITLLEIARDVDARADGRPSVLITGLQHAREWPSGEVVTELAWDLVRAVTAGDDRVRRLLGEVRVLLVPVANPDGFVVSRAAPSSSPDGATTLQPPETAAAEIAGASLSFKRKNCNPVGSRPGDVPCAFAAGVDLNRNYSAGWGGAGSSGDPTTETYRGDAPFSEPESRAIRDLVVSEGPTVVLAIHNVGGLVLRPPGVEGDGPVADEEALRALGDAMADAAGHRSRRGWELYPTTGTTDEWAYQATGAFGFTIELGPPGGTFHGDHRRHVVDEYLGSGRAAGRGVREAMLLAAEAARDPEQVGRLDVVAPPGRTLRLTKRFSTSTSGDRRVEERLRTRTVVPTDGRAEWWVNPSTRPRAAADGRRERYVLECVDGGEVKEREPLVVARGETAVLALRCGGPARDRRTAGGAALGTLRTTAAVANRRRRVVVRIGTRAPLQDVRVRLLERSGGRVLATGRRARLPGSRRVGLRLRPGARLAPGAAYRLSLEASRPGGTPVRLARAVSAARRR